MRNIFILSILSEYAEMILSGSKQWEFRRNPRFGTAGQEQIKPGNILFVVSMSDDPVISYYCIVEKILRGTEYLDYFSNPGYGRWKESGYSSGTDQDFNCFKKEVLEVHSTAVKLKPYKLNDPVPVKEIRQRYTNKPWSGRGFSHIGQLKRFEYRGFNFDDYLREIVSGEHR